MWKLRPRSAYRGGMALLVVGACAPDLGELVELPPSDSVVVAQFDPTNPIPQLRLIPSPTALAQNPDGTINKDAVRPAPCQLPTESQCLQFVEGGWPTTLFPTFNFSAPLVMDTVGAGLRLFQVGEMGLTEVEVEVEQAPRPLPPAACQEGGNNTMPPRTFTAADVTAAWGPEATNVVLRPRNGPLEPGTSYIAVATTALRGSPRQEGGGPREIEPSALFYLLNNETAPVAEDGQILDPLLRANVQGSVLAGLFPGRTADSLNSEERAQLNAALASSGRSLFGLYQFVNGSVSALLGSGLIADRSEVVMINTWRTGDPPGRQPSVVVFDPAGTSFPTDVRFPLPNDQLLTIPAEVPGGLRVNFPTEGLTGTLASVLTAANTLNGFGLTTPIVMQVSQPIDPESLPGNVLMAELDAMGMPTGDLAPIAALAVPARGDEAPQLVVVPTRPLRPNTRYAVGVTTRVRDTDGQPIAASQTFNFLKSPEPLIADGQVNPAIEPLLQCSTLASTGSLAPPEQVIATATALEVGLARPRWQEAFRPLEGLTPPVPRTELAMAFTYKAQSITDVVDAMKAALPQYELLPPNAGVRLLPTEVDVVGTATVAALMGLSDPAQIALFATGIGRARLHLLRTYQATAGNPFTAGSFTPPTVMMPRVSYVPVWVITPAGTPPAAGWPVVVFQHGLGQAKESGLFIAGTFARAGWATVVMDMPFHGARASDIANNDTGVPCTDIDPAAVTCNPANGMCMGGCDGRQDSSGTGFLSPNIFGVRDNFRQATVDQLALLRTLRQDAGMAMSLIGDLDGTRVGYVGQSLGGIAGGNLAAYVSPAELDAAVLNVAGGNIIDVLQNTVPTISAPLWLGLAQAGVCMLEDPLNPALGCQDTPLFRTFLLLAQWVTEPGDPNGNSVGVIQQLPMRPEPLGTNRLLLQMSRPDPVVHNPSTLRLANAYGFDLAGGDRRFQTYDFTGRPGAETGGGCHGFLLQPSCGRCPQEALCATFGAQQQAAAFVNSAGMTVADQLPMSLLGGMINCQNPCGN